MNSPDLNIGQSGPAASRPVIRQLDEGAINRIAAGEVVERPASAVKELVENAIDAGAHRITVDYADGGKTLIRVTDDGCGMTADDLPLALSRHATSKIDGTDLLNIHTFGFRGEALPSLGAVGRLKITSRAEGNEGVSLSISGGRVDPIKPAALTKGTVVELRDLFFATPARLKFLRTDRAEAKAISDVVKRLAMAEPFVGFVLRDVSGGGEGRVTFRADPQTGDMFDALHGRLATVLGKEFAENALAIDAEREGLHLTGYAALPTYSRGSSVAQFLFVNGRPVQDRLLLGALRAAYFDYLSRDRHPAACLFIDVDPHRVDVNVHPAKSEVRFREPAEARSLIVSGLRNALAAAGHRASTTVAQDTLKAMQPETPFLGSQDRASTDDVAPRIYQMDRRGVSGYTMPPRPSADGVQNSYEWQAPARANAPGFAEMAAPSARVEEVMPQPVAEKLPLGAARAQVHENYIIAQTDTGIVIVDQHAAHERLVYEKLKKLMAENGVASQALLIPEVIELGVNDAQTLLDLADDLAGLGLVIEAFGAGTIAVRETPAILGRVDATAMISDILDELADLGDSQTVQARIEAVLSRVACHGSIRSGRWMRGEEMNALLREMEATPHSGQCNHGRPTYVELKLSDIERLFGRT
jgi:DNA mismatch repair protein MutL